MANLNNEHTLPQALTQPPRPTSYLSSFTHDRQSHTDAIELLLLI